MATAFGLDLGSSGLSVAVQRERTIDLLLDDLALRRTPPDVAFTGRQRLTGHAAHDAPNASCPPPLVPALFTLQGGEAPETDGQETHGAGPRFAVKYEFDGAGEHVLSLTQLVATLLKPLAPQLAAQQGSAVATSEADGAAESEEAGTRPLPPLAVPLPDHVLGNGLSSSVVADAVALAALPVTGVHVIPASHCVAAAYAHRHRLELGEQGGAVGVALLDGADAVEAEIQGSASGEEPTTAPSTTGDSETSASDPAAATDAADAATTEYVAVLDVGKAQTQVTVLAVRDGVVRVASVAGETVGGGDFDVALFAVLADRLADKGESVSLHSRDGGRLLREVERARRVLSANTSCAIVLEAFGPNGNDYRLDVTRTELATATQALTARVAALLPRALETASVAATSVAGVELLGGCTCMPALHDAVSAVLGEGRLRTTLDRSLAMAIGAARAAGAAGSAGIAPTACSWVPETLAAAQAAEARMQAQDDAIRAVGDARNALEAFILSARGARDGPHGKLLHEDATRTALAEAEDWLYSDEAEAAVTPTVYVERLAALETCLRELNSDYYAALDADAVEKAEREAADRARWEAEAANQSAEDKEDHDFRRMKKADRMKYVLKNKDEATELFKDGNYAHATQRYVRALGHAAKFVDLNADDEAEVAGVKAILHLNLAMCYLKQSAWKKALASCDDAIALNAANPKAYYRKASALEKLNDFKGGLEAARAGLALAADDIAMAKLATRLEAKHKHTVEQEKKKYAKMFA